MSDTDWRYALNATGWVVGYYEKGVWVTASTHDTAEEAEAETMRHREFAGLCQHCHTNPTEPGRVCCDNDLCKSADIA